MERINGSVEKVKKNLVTGCYYTVYCLSETSYQNLDPNPPLGINKGVNIFYTGNLKDQSQKNFEMLIQSIGLRCLPVITGIPTAVKDVSLYGAKEISGEGFIWKFATDNINVFSDAHGNPVGLLEEELDGMVLDNGIRVTTSRCYDPTYNQNIEFRRER